MRVGGMEGGASMPEPVNAVVITPDSNASITPITPDLETMNGLVGGYLEAVTPSTGSHRTWHAYVDDEGKYKQQPINQAANVILARLGWQGALVGDFVVGTVVLLGSDGSKEASVPDDVVTIVKQFYAEHPEVTLSHDAGEN